MNFKTAVIAVFLIFLISIQVSATPGKIKYFGFWGDAMENTGNGNYIDQTSSMSNVHYISADLGSGSVELWREKVLQAKRDQHKVVLMLEGGLFQWATVKLNPSRDYLLNDLRNRLDGLEDTILGVYLFDEPYWKNSLSSSPISDQQVFNNLSDAAKSVKTYFPNAIIMLTEAAPAINERNISFSKNIDWIGANCYVYYSECTNLTELENLYKKLSANFLPNQKLLFTLDGHWMGREQALKPETQNKIVARNDGIIKLSAKFDSVAYFPFLYQSQENIIGTGEMPIVKNYFKKLGSAIKAGTFDPATWVVTPVPIECKILEPKCEGKDYVRRDSCGKELDRWANAPEPYCPKEVIPIQPPVSPPVVTPPPIECKILEPKCEGRDYVRRDSCGKEIERWKNAPEPYCPKEVIPIQPPVSMPPVPAPVETPPPVECKILEPKCEGKDYVRRDSCGKETDRWLNAPVPYCPAP